jgi:hypothetical protein
VEGSQKKAQSRGKKTAKELAQGILCKKLEGSQPDFNAQARERLTKLFDTPIPNNAMEAI